MCADDTLPLCLHCASLRTNSKSKPAPNFHARYETKQDFYYPMRLILSAVISMFLCFVVGFFLAVGMAWAVEWGNEAIAAYEDTSDQVAMALLWPPAKSRYGIISRIVFNAFGVGLYFLRLVLTPATCMCGRAARVAMAHSLSHSLTHSRVALRRRPGVQRHCAPRHRWFGVPCLDLHACWYIGAGSTAPYHAV